MHDDLGAAEEELITANERMWSHIDSSGWSGMPVDVASDGGGIPRRRRSGCGQMMKNFAAIFVCLLFLGCVDLLAEPNPPTDLAVCGLGCSESLPTSFIFLDCPGYPSAVFAFPRGRHWWGPLTCVGPIEISLQLLEWGGTSATLPLTLEVRRDAGTANCRLSRSGEYIWQTSETEMSCDPDSLWIRSPLIDLPGIIGLGAEYWLQLQGSAVIDQEGGFRAVSPYLSCVRLRAFPTLVTASSWAKVKNLYR